MFFIQLNITTAFDDFTAQEKKKKYGADTDKAKDSVKGLENSERDESAEYIDTDKAKDSVKGLENSERDESAEYMIYSGADTDKAKDSVKGLENSERDESAEYMEEEKEVEQPISSRLSEIKGKHGYKWNKCSAGHHNKQLEKDQIGRNDEVREILNRPRTTEDVNVSNISKRSNVTADGERNRKNVLSTKNCVENIEVNNFTTRKRSIRGKNTSTTLTAVENRKWIFASNFVNSTTEDDIKEHLVSNKMNSLDIFLSDLKPNVISLTEHWLRISQVLSVNMSDYEMASCYSRSLKIHGGSCILLKKGVPYTELVCLKQKSKELIFECLQFAPNYL
ncbi:hypothetical protein QE152_g25205 [Popillia japonica]|uniref:Uncharacterized protein n=1 Tax=Popillia japonica TaxID=7064 RepID=A0AAW1K2D9_POPJA